MVRGGDGGGKCVPRLVRVLGRVRRGDMGCGMTSDAERLRSELQAATEAANAEWSSPGPRLAVCQELSRREQELRVELVKLGECCGWRYDSPLSPRCGCSAVRQHIAESLIDSGQISSMEAHEWADYCSICEAFKLAVAMRLSGMCGKISLHNLIRVANEQISGKAVGSGNETCGDSDANCERDRAN
jgi:hypothetical protein